MSRGSTIRYDQTGGPLRAAIDAALARPENAVTQRSGLHALGGKGQAPKGVVDLPGPLHVRIVRRVPSPGRLDDDNLQGGCKQLRDAIAEYLCREGDSETDGLTWEVSEEQGPTEVVIEVYRNEQPRLED